MACSQAKVESNRKNAALSTGPKTEEGKAKSRANALKHGLCCSALVPESLEQVEERAGEYFYTFKPQTQYHMWVLRKMSVISLRLDRSERMERRYRDRKSHRAMIAWDLDRQAEIDKLGFQISKKPAEVVATLKRTTVGCDWLISRWNYLEDRIKGDRTWTEEVAKIAFDLLGMPVEFREDRTPGQELTLFPLDPVELARFEKARLVQQRAMVAELDEVDRALTEVDLFDESHPELKSLRRHEATLYARLRWCHKQLDYQSPHLRPHPDLIPKWTLTNDPPPPFVEPPVEAQTVAAAVAGPAKSKPAKRRMAPPSHPPFDLTPDEYPKPGERSDIPKLVVGRLEKRAKKTSKNREAKRRKAERLRA